MGADERRRDELRVEVGGKESFKKKLVRSRLKWDGHVERMGVETLAGRGGRRRRGRPRMRREDSVKRDLERVGGEWRTRAEDRRSWRLLIENAVR